jgi:hypothetical protein
VQHFSYREILQRLSGVDHWLKERGLCQHDRLRIHRQNIDRLAKAHEEGRLNHFVTALPEDKRREILWSFVESIELLDVSDGLERTGFEIPIDLLERSLDGPADPFLEDPKSTAGRNAMFEIWFAGRVALAGLTPILGGEPDVFCEFAGRRMFIQCKRVFSENGIAKRIREAEKQLRRDLDASANPKDCGLIAVSTTRVVNAGDRIFTVGSESDLRPALNREMDRIIEGNGRTLREVHDPRVVGMFLQMATPAFVEETALFTVAQSITAFPIPGRCDDAVLKSFADLITR